MTILGIFISVVIFVCILWYINFYRYQFFLWKFPGPMSFPIIGNIHHLQPGKGLIPSLIKLIEKYGEVVNLTFGSRTLLVFSGSKAMEFILSSTVHLKKGNEYQFVKPWIGDGLLSSSGIKWKTHRKLLTPAFHFSILNKFVDIFEEQSNILIHKMDKMYGEFDIIPYFKSYALDALCESTMNISINAQTDKKSDYVKNLEAFFIIVMNRFLSLVKRWEIFFKFSNEYIEQQRAIKVLNEYTDSFIEKRKKYLSTYTDNYNENAEKLAFIDILLQSKIDGNLLPDHAITEQANTFLFAGNDTVASALSFLTYALSKHEYAQEKLAKELLELFGTDLDRPLSYQDLQKTKYLDQVIKESLRMYTPVPFVTRLLEEEAFFDGKIIPKNVSILIFMYGMHQQPSLYPNPEIFDPERFSVENSKNRSLYSYIPFSAGPRNCIGQRFALLQIKYTVTKIVRRFKLLPVENHKPELVVHVALASTNGLPVRLQKREY